MKIDAPGTTQMPQMPASVVVPANTGTWSPRVRPLPFTLSCVVPAFNEARNLERFVPALAEALAALAPRFEIVVVNDGSRDDTGTVVTQLAARYPLLYLELSRNFGKEAALTAGIDAAVGDAVLLIDADFQHPLASVPEMVQRWRDGDDMVYAVRRDRRDEGVIKRIGVRGFYRLMSAGARVKIPEGAGDFRLLDRRVVDALRALPERNRFMKGLYGWVGFRTSAVEFDVEPRLLGESHFNLRALLHLAVTGLTSFSNLPLRIWSAIGLAISAIAFGYGAWIVIEHWLFDTQWPGYATLAASMMLLAGVQLISVGVLGEYLGRVYNEVKQRPIYIVGARLSTSPLRDASGHAADAVSAARATADRLATPHDPS